MGFKLGILLEFVFEDFFSDEKVMLVWFRFFVDIIEQVWLCVFCDVLIVDFFLFCEDFVFRFDIFVDNDGGLEDGEFFFLLFCLLLECDKFFRINI